MPDDVVVRIVRDRIAEPDCKNGYLLDGFPRTLPQAEALASFESIDVVVNLEVPASLLIHRLSGRRVCAQCGYTTHVDRGEAKCPKCGAGADAAQGRCAGVRAEPSGRLREADQAPDRLLRREGPAQERGRLQAPCGSHRGHSGGPWEQLDDHIQNASRD